MNKRLIILCLITIIVVVSFSCNDKPFEPQVRNLIVSEIDSLYTAPYLGNSPGQTYIYITSSDNSALNFEFSNKSNWLDLFNPQHTTFGTTPDSILMNIRVMVPNPLPEGEYFDTITISSDEAENSPIELEVRLRIGSEIETIPGSLEFIGGLNGSNPTIQSFEINSTTDLEFEVVLTNSASWLTIPFSSYNTHDTDLVPVSIDLTGLTKGLYKDTIWISSDIAMNSPYPIPVTLMVSSWIAQESPQKNNLNDVYFIDEMNGWAVGDVIDNYTKSGFLIKTTDGGDIWQKALFLNSTEPDADSILGAVSFIGSEGWTVGSSSIIMHSVDGGDNWEFQTSPVNDSVDFINVLFVTADSGWIVGKNGTILRTIDGGDNWTAQTSNTTQQLTGISFVDSQNGWICGLTDVILITSDGGENWTKQVVPSGPAGDKYDFKEIAFTDLNHGWTIGKEGLVVSTSDGGLNWSFDQLPVSDGLLSVCFLDNFYGWISGQNGVVFHTEDGGSTWGSQFVETSSSLNSIFFINQNKGWVVGGDGDIFFTASGGN